MDVVRVSGGCGWWLESTHFFLHGSTARVDLEVGRSQQAL